jgi:hypothetical protein
MNADILLKHMATGSTGSTRQIGLLLRCGEHNLAKYMRALAANGLVERNGFVRMPRSQRDAAVWRITPKGLASIKKQPTVAVKARMAPGGGRLT